MHTTTFATAALLTTFAIAGCSPNAVTVSESNEMADAGAGGTGGATSVGKGGASTGTGGVTGSGASSGTGGSSGKGVGALGGMGATGGVSGNTGGTTGGGKAGTAGAAGGGGGPMLPYCAYGRSSVFAAYKPLIGTGCSGNWCGDQVWCCDNADNKQRKCVQDDTGTSVCILPGTTPCTGGGVTALTNLSCPTGTMCVGTTTKNHGCCPKGETCGADPCEVDHVGVIAENGSAAGVGGTVCTHHVVKDTYVLDASYFTDLISISFSKKPTAGQYTAVPSMPGPAQVTVTRTQGSQAPVNANGVVVVLADGSVKFTDLALASGGGTLSGWYACGTFNDVCDQGALCGGVCTDVKTDSKNCNSCGVVCPSGSSCTDAVCCSAGKTGCSGACVSLSNDAQNCGSCGKNCPFGTPCIGGKCMCPAGQTSCNSGCVDTTKDGTNCGGCGNNCFAGSSCVGGVCTCAAGTTSCASTCVDTTNDVANCGGCGKACPAQLCVASSCAPCPADHKICNSACTDVLNDTKNCGVCGLQCPSGIACTNGVCCNGVCF